MHENIPKINANPNAQIFYGMLASLFFLAMYFLGMLFSCHPFPCHAVPCRVFYLDLVILTSDVDKE